MSRAQLWGQRFVDTRPGLAGAAVIAIRATDERRNGVVVWLCRCERCWRALYRRVTDLRSTGRIACRQCHPMKRVTPWLVPMMRMMWQRHGSLYDPAAEAPATKRTRRAIAAVMGYEPEERASAPHVDPGRRERELVAGIDALDAVCADPGEQLALA